jgi:hypothetical protein
MLIFSTPRKKIVMYFIFLIFLDISFGNIFSYYEQEKRNTLISFREAYDSEVVANDIFGFGFRPLVDIVAYWNVVAPYAFRTNSLGFKDNATRSIMQHSKKRRILFLGDSFTEGVGFSYDKTFVGRIGEKFETCDVEVLNGAVHGYAPSIYVRKLKWLIEDMSMKIDEVVVFYDLSDPFNEFFNYKTDSGGNLVVNLFPLGQARRDDAFFVTDDTGVTSIQHALEITPIPKREIEEKKLCDNYRCYWKKFRKSVKHNSLLIRTISIINKKIRFELDDEKRLGLRFVPSSPYVLWTLEDKEYERYGRSGLDRSNINMTKLVELARTNGIKTTVVVYPWPDQIYGRDLNSRQVLYWKSWAAEHQVSFINLFPDFIENRDPRRVIKEFFIPGDSHFNERGHEKIADLFLEQHQSSCQ